MPATQGMVVSLGLPLLHRNALFNCACLAVDGRIAGFVAKRFLCGDGLHYEPRWFKPWPQAVRDTSADGREYPIGDLVFDCGGVKIGFEICEDAWVAGRPGGDMSPHGVDVILNPSASHFAFGKFEVRKRLVLEGSRAFHVSYVYANLLGNEAGRVIYDGGALIASGGTLLAAGPRFSFAPWRLTSAVVDVAANAHEHRPAGSFEPSWAAEPLEVAVPFAWPDVEPEAGAAASGRLGSRVRDVKEEEFARAVALGLFDYLRKSRSQGFVVSLSGGADSSAVSCLVALMVELACGELGAEPSRSARHISGLTRRRKRTARPGASPVALRLPGDRATAAPPRASAMTWPRPSGPNVLPGDRRLVEGYVAGIEQVLGRPLTWETDDIALQNIQARVRAPERVAAGQREDALLLSTSNRSEAAVGYATMDGDTCGGLSPIAGIDKAFLLDWLRWLETDGPGGLHPIPALAAVNADAADGRTAAAGRRPDRRRRPHAVPRARRHRACRHPRQAAAAEGFSHDPAAVPAVQRGPVAALGRTVLPALVPQPVEAGTLRPQFPPGRREPRPQNLVPLSDPLRWFRTRIGGTAGICGGAGKVGPFCRKGLLRHVPRESPAVLARTAQ